jgi:WD40 repeat protein
VLRGVIQLKFSNGGHMLAAAYPRQKHNIHQINIYNSYTLEEIARLSDHSNVITELTWRFDDKFLYSVGVDGTVSEWKFSESKESKEWVCKKWNQNNSKYSSVVFEKNAKSILTAGFESNKSVIR